MDKLSPAAEPLSADEQEKEKRSALGRGLQALRKTHGAGRKPRTVLHDTSGRYCFCVDCRKARGQYPPHLLDQPKPAKTAKPAKRRKRTT